MHLLLDILRSTWNVLGEMGPYLMLGFLVAGALSAFVSPAWVERHLGGRGLRPVVKTALLGVPLPLCSCGVLPVAASLRTHGASKGAAVSFLIATPQTGVDSIFATYALLGPVFAVFRPITALISGIAGGAIISLFDTWTGSAGQTPPEQSPKPPDGCRDACDTIEHQGSRWRGAVYYGLVTLPRDIAKALLIGALIAGALTVLVPQGALTPYLGGGMLAMLIMIAVGIPMYVCATASIPMAVAFMHLGATPGAALAFLIAGPATNVAAFAVVWKILGRGATLVYLATIAAGALFSGMALDILFTLLDAASPHLASHAHVHPHSGILQPVWATLLLALLAGSYLIPRMTPPHAPAARADETAITLKIAGMTCGHCAETVARALRDVTGVTHATVNLERNEATVTGKEISFDALSNAIKPMGFDTKQIAP